MAVSQTLLKALLASVAIYTFYILATAIYNVTLHPLAKYPGPKFDAAFEFPWHWHHTTGSSPFHTKLLHEQYGDIVRVSPNQLSYIKSQAWKDINGPRKGKKHLIRDPVVFAPPQDQAPDIILSTDADHTRFRRVLGFSFSDAALREQEPMVRSYCDTLVTRLNEQIGEKIQVQIDIVNWLNFTTFDIIGDLVFSENFHALEKGVYHPWMHNVFKALKFVVIAQSAAVYPWFNAAFQALLRNIDSIQKARASHRGDTTDKVVRRIESKEDHKDFMSHILRHNDEKGLNQDEIVTNSAVLILAGSETTATLLSGLTFLLLTNPKVMSKLQEEVYSSFTSHEEMTFASEAKLPYLHACIQEALRIYPPSPSALARRTPVGGIIIDGQFVPENVSVGVHQYSAFHSASNFTDPETFAPERWLNDPYYASDDLEVMRPFGMGSHYCLGVGLAYAEMRSILTRLVWNFKMELCEDSKDFLNQKVFLLWEKPALNVKISSRF